MICHLFELVYACPCCDARFEVLCSTEEIMGDERCPTCKEGGEDVWGSPVEEGTL